MAIRTYKVTLDSKNSIAPEPVFLRQGDKTGAVVIDATLMDNGSPVSLSGLTPMFKANTANGQAVIVDSTGFNIVNASGGEFTYQVPSQLGSVSGKIKIAYFSFSDSSGAQSTFNVVFVVEKAVDMTQESAKDWVSNLNEIIDQYNQWVNNAHSSWQDFVNENKEIIESIDPGGTLLAEVIDARNDGEQSFKSLGERLNQTLSIDDSIDGYAIRNVFRPEINRVKELINQDNLNLLFITDLHWEQDNSNAYAHSNRSLSHLSNALAFDDKVDAIILGGDNTNSYSKSLDYIKKQIEQVNDKLYDTGKSDRFSLLGNHDDGSLRSVLLDRALKPSDIINNAEFMQYMRAGSPNNGETRMPGNLALYKDYPRKKIRVIGLNALDIPDSLTNADGTIKYNRQHKFAYSETQLKWLAEEALKVPEDYQTVVFSHIQTAPAPVTGEITDRTDVRYNYDLLQQLLWAFQAGTSVVLNSEQTDFRANFNADFTTQGKRTLVGFINGHTHWESIVNVGTFTDVHCLNSIYEGVGDELINQGSGKPDRKLNDVTEDAFTIVSIDPANNHVDLIGFGAATNRGYDYA